MHLLGGDTISEALSIAVNVLYFNDNSDYETSLYEIVGLLGGQEAVDLLLKEPRSAFLKYNKQI